jgi:hypothetical protein
MTKQEMKDAMDAGKTLYDDEGHRAWMDIDHECGPYVFQYSDENYDYMKAAWSWKHWKIEGETSKQHLMPKRLKNNVVGQVVGHISVTLDCDWKIKGEGEREFDFKPFDRVLVRDTDKQNWTCALFSHYNKNYTYQFIGVGNAYKQIAHFEGNEKYLGTTDDIPGKWTAEEMEK